MQCVAFHLKQSGYRLTPRDISWQNLVRLESWHPLTSWRLVSSIRSISTTAVPKGLKFWVHYAIANVFDSNIWPWKWRSRTLRIWMKISRRGYLGNVHMSAKICTSRFSRLFKLELNFTVQSWFGWKLTGKRTMSTCICMNNLLDIVVNVQPSPSECFEQLWHTFREGRTEKRKN